MMQECTITLFFNDHVLYKCNNLKSTGKKTNNTNKTTQNRQQVVT